MNSRHHLFFFSILLLIALLVSCTTSPASLASGSIATQAVETAQPGNPSSNGGCSNAYFPTSLGTSWSYSSSGNPLGAYTFTWTVAGLNEQGLTTNDQYSTGVHAIIKWTCNNGNLAALNGGSNSLSLTTSKVSMKSNSITAEGYNIPANFDAGNSWSEKVIVDGTVINNAAKTVTTQIVTQLNCSVAGTDSITVPAGKFDTVKASCTETVSVSALMQGTAVPAGAPVTIHVTNWYAKGVGLVQSVRKGGTTGAETISLTHYEVH